MAEVRHLPVLVAETIGLLAPEPGQTVLDATVGLGGHAESLLPRLGKTGRYLALDADAEALEIARERLKAYGPQVEFFHTNFRELDRTLDRLGLRQVDRILMDLGVSSLQLCEARRGFTFAPGAPLDMRMDAGSSGPTAADLLNSESREGLERILREYGEEPEAARLAHAIVERRRSKRFTLAEDLADLVLDVCGPRGRIHPATQAFQALRIAVNRELQSLDEGLRKAIKHLAPGGRMAAIGFHSLEDRIVKQLFREASQRPEFRILTPKPIRPTSEEVRRNPRSRSARLRGLERILA